MTCPLLRCPSITPFGFKTFSIACLSTSAIQRSCSFSAFATLLAVRACNHATSNNAPRQLQMSWFSRICSNMDIIVFLKTAPSSRASTMVPLENILFLVALFVGQIRECRRDQRLTRRLRKILSRVRHVASTVPLLWKRSWEPLTTRELDETPSSSTCGCVVQTSVGSHR